MDAILPSIPYIPIMGLSSPHYPIDGRVVTGPHARLIDSFATYHRAALLKLIRFSKGGASWLGDLGARCKTHEGRRRRCREAVEHTVGAHAVRRGGGALGSTRPSRADDRRGAIDQSARRGGSAPRSSADHAVRRSGGAADAAEGGRSHSSEPAYERARMT